MKNEAAQAGELKPFAYFVYIPAEQRGEFVHDLDDAMDDLTNCECEVTELFAALPAVQPAESGAIAPVPYDKHEAEMLAVIDERDRYHDMADQLAEQIAAITGEEIGEHSSGNDPWRNAMLAADEWIASDLRAMFEGRFKPRLAALSQPATTEAVEEMSPEFTDTARAALLWVLWHHQGASSKVGQPIRFALGMGQFDRLSEYQVREAKRWEALAASPSSERQDVGGGKP